MAEVQDFCNVSLFQLYTSIRFINALIVWINNEETVIQAFYNHLINERAVRNYKREPDTAPTVATVCGCLQLSVQTVSWIYSESLGNFVGKWS
jgi:hypothetical protein